MGELRVGYLCSSSSVGQRTSTRPALVTFAERKRRRNRKSRGKTTGLKRDSDDQLWAGVISSASQSRVAVDKAQGAIVTYVFVLVVVRERLYCQCKLLVGCIWGLEGLIAQAGFS